MDPKDLKAAKQELEQIKSLQDDITKNSARYNVEGKLGIKATKEAIALKEQQMAIEDAIARAEKENAAGIKNHAKNLTSLVQLKRKNLSAEKNMFGLSERVNKLATDNITILNEQVKQKKIAGDLGQTLTDATMEIAKGNLDVLGLKDQEKALQEELIGLDKERDKETIKAIKGTVKLNKLEQERQETLEEANSFMSAADGIIGGMGDKIKGFMTNPLTAAVALLLTFNATQQSIADQFGAIGVTEFRSDLATTNAEFTKFGLSAADAQTATSEIANNFGLSVSESSELAVNARNIKTATGASLTDSSKLLGIFKETQNLTAQQAENLLISTTELAVANNVAPDKVLADVAKSTEFFAQFADDGGENILRAAVQAKKLGLELSDIEKITTGLLGFQESLVKEQEASVMIGRRLNFQKTNKIEIC